MKIIADRHEKNSLVIAELISQGIEVELRSLEVADYLVGDVAIERKTVRDFASSIINKRLVRQLHELQQYSSRLLILEGYEEQELYESNVHENAIRGMLLSAALDFSIPIIFTKDSEDTAKFLAVLAKRQEKKPTQFALKVKRRVFSLAEQQQLVVEGFPGIGPASAKKLLSHFGTIKAITNATEEKLEKIIGKKSKTIKKIIESKYKG